MNEWGRIGREGTKESLVWRLAQVRGKSSNTCGERARKEWRWVKNSIILQEWKNCSSIVQSPPLISFLSPSFNQISSSRKYESSTGLWVPPRNGDGTWIWRLWFHAGYFFDQYTMKPWSHIKHGLEPPLNGWEFRRFSPASMN